MINIMGGKKNTLNILKVYLYRRLDTHEFIDDKLHPEYNIFEMNIMSLVYLDVEKRSMNASS